MMKYQRMQQERKALLNRGARHWLDDGSEDAATAQHEAAHALISRLLGLNPRSVTIEPGADYGGMTILASASHRVFDRIVCLVAGSEAERMFGGPDNGCKNDLLQARALADEDMIKRARRVARKILKANLGPLTKLAIALLDRRTLDLAEIEEIIAANAPDDDVSDDGDDGDDETSYVGEPDDGALLVRAILPDDGMILHHPPTPLV
jgi:hypothetical protein